MEDGDKGCPMIRMGVSGWMFLLVPAYPGSPKQKAIKRLCVCVCGESMKDLLAGDVFDENACCKVWVILQFSLYSSVHSSDVFPVIRILNTGDSTVQ